MKAKLISILKLIIPIFIGAFLIWAFYDALCEDQKKELFIAFEKADYEFLPENSSELRAWIKASIEAEKRLTGMLNYIFTNDENLLSINQSYLNHDTYTDIITFDYCEDNTVSGDIYISVEGVIENAKKFDVSTTDELHRVIIHGTLHLCGYGDKTPEEKALMTEKEDYYLSLRHF